MTLVFGAKLFFSLNKANDSENVLNNCCALRYRLSVSVMFLDENMPVVHVSYSLAQPKMGGEKDITGTYECFYTC